MKKDKDAEEILNEVHCKEDVVAEARNFPNEEGKSLTHFFFVISKDLDFQEVERLQVKKMIEYILKFETVFMHTNEELFQFICQLLKIFCEDFKSEIESFEHFTKKGLILMKTTWFINEALVFICGNSDIGRFARLTKILYDHGIKTFNTGYQCKDDVFNAIISYHNSSPKHLKLLNLSKSIYIFARKHFERESYHSKEVCFLDWLLNCPLKFYNSTSDLLKLTKYFIVCQLSNGLKSMPGLPRILCGMSFITEKEASLIKDISFLKQNIDDKVTFGKQLMRFAKKDLLPPALRKNCQSIAVLCACKR